MNNINTLRDGQRSAKPLFTGSNPVAASSFPTNHPFLGRELLENNREQVVISLSTGSFKNPLAVCWQTPLARGKVEVEIMGICGRFAPSFKEANLASCVDVHMESDYTHGFFFDILSVDEAEKTVRLRAHKGGTVFDFKIHKGKVSEFTYIEQASSYEMFFCNGKPKKIKIVPFKGNRT